MPAQTTQQGTRLVRRSGRETLQIEPWGPHAVRVRATVNPTFHPHPEALLEAAPSDASLTVRDDGAATLVNGQLRVELNDAGQLRFLRERDGQCLLAEPTPRILKTPARDYRAVMGDLWRLHVTFEPREGERFYGLGQHRHGLFDQKGAVVELQHRNCEVNIPFLLSSRGYGLLWHNPGVGRVELATTGTRWVADGAWQVDYWVVAGETPAEIVQRYVQATGLPPMMPDWASGFWQSKLRYRTRDEFMAIADQYQERGLPLSVLVCDFFHWPRMGDLEFDQTEWPDPADMIAKLEHRGVKTLVSVWPSFNRASRNYEPFEQDGLLVETERGQPAIGQLFDKPGISKTFLAFYDPTHPAARQRFWNEVKVGYYDKGVRLFWLDACEPEMKTDSHDNLRFYLGNGLAVACLYPFLHEQAFFDGMTAQGERDILFLCRSGWAGSQRYGAAIWSGDIESTFESMRLQIRAGLNMAISGIPWWNTDIGGFLWADPEDPEFRELLVRWFQWGTFLPIMRLHGHRQPLDDMAGGPNEVWSYGEDNYEILKKYLFLRERLRPYILESMKTASETGLPAMRPLLLAFPGDPACWDNDDQYLFGPDLLVCPVYEQAATTRDCYLPAGASWTDAWTGEVHEGGQRITVEAPLDRIPLFLKDGAELPIRG